MGRGESTLIYRSFEARIALGDNVALLKSFIEPAAVSFILSTSILLVHIVKQCAL
jgi:hypothetical protein